MAVQARFSFELVPQAARNIAGCGPGQTVLLSWKLGSKRADSQALAAEAQAVEWAAGADAETLRLVASLKRDASCFGPKHSSVSLKVYNAKQKLLHHYSLKLDLATFAKAGQDSDRSGEKLVLSEASTGRTVELFVTVRSRFLPDLPRMTEEPALADLSDVESDISIDCDCDDEEGADGTTAAAGAALQSAPVDARAGPEAAAALQAELAANRKLLANAHALAEEYKMAAEKIAAAAEEKEAKRMAAFGEELAAAKVAALAARADSEALAGALAAAEAKLADAARNQTGFGFHTPSRKAASRLALACPSTQTPPAEGARGLQVDGGVTPVRRWATAAPAPRPRRNTATHHAAPAFAATAGHALSDNNSPPSHSSNAAGSVEAGEAGAPAAVWTVRRKDMDEEEASDLVCFQLEQILREKAQMANEAAALMRENRALADRCDLLEGSMGDRSELLEELTLARDQAAEELVAVTEALAAARAEASTVRRRAEGAEEARALLQEQLTAEKAAAAAAEMSLTQALILSRTATAQADFDRERAALEARTRRAEAARQRQRNAVLAREVTRQEVEIALLVRENAMQRNGGAGAQQLRAFGSGVAESAAEKMEQFSSGLWGMGKKGRGVLTAKN